MKTLFTTAALVLGVSTLAQAQSADLDALLNKVREGRVTEEAEHKQREAEFLQRRDQQQQLLQQARQEQQRLEREAERLEEQRRVNEERITQLLEQRRERAGQLQELFGVLQQSAGDARSIISTSHVSIDNTDRLDGINTLVAKAADSAELPTLDEIRSWPTQMMLEMIESSKVVTFPHEVRRTDGTTEVVDLTRIGDFTILGAGKYYTLKNDGSVEELQRQPSGRITGTVSSFQSATSGMAAIGVDPTRGQILNLEVEKPTLQERIDQGGTVGYLILALGAIGVLMAVVQFLYLTVVSGKVRKQIRSGTPSKDNPLGRVLSVYEENKNVDVETLELKLDEAILKETPALERFLTLIKLISAVAPLFGLLGTVTGMIETFQAITLFGTGDPTMMASGISMALITTVEGLVVAIPTLLLHSFVSGASKSVIHVLEEQSAGIIAVHAEKEHANAGA
ncbi:MotA/TolQ/ExbB proton channel family protein [Eilatimonas milleporae]|uniref:Outer membrane transport energization protein ExbB n=1 Tax=Eilatimonas milleporae TaxID=911205 RepID=A0A3M0BYX2_9PROT|nr:MotA/TolQ/ExbB proton channel family protein [Eilatimonas milleporae]RMB02678.1 outer membrane transport energization protein ExbB [Eilatimonas milleporae]